MPKSKKLAAVDPSNPPTHFFEKQLAGEEPPRLETMKRLYEVSRHFFDFAPWEHFGDRELVLLEDPISKETCHCLVMGALGEVFALQAYIGNESYRLQKRIRAREPLAPEDFFSALTGVGVEFVVPSELTKLDKELLRALGNPVKRGARVPLFRAYRPGYRPWHITEPEAITLTACVEATNAMFLEVLKYNDTSWWAGPDSYPFMVPNAAEKRGYEIRKVTAPRPPAPAPVPAVIDEARIRRIQENDCVLKGAFEADHFQSMITVGEKNARPALAQVALVSDAASGFAFPPEISDSCRPPGDVLASAVLKAIETVKFLPAEVRVKNNDAKTFLEPLAGQLGIGLRVVKSLPAVQSLKSHLLAYMGR